MRHHLSTVLIPAIALSATLFATDGQAGVQKSSAYCYKYSNGMGYCYGTFAGFRNSADTSAYAQFRVTHHGGAQFTAMLNRVSYACIADASVSSFFPQAMAARGYFSIEWDSTGTCTDLELLNGSQYSSY